MAGIKPNPDYPGGMSMPGRSYSSGSYRFGMNGQEKDDEIDGNGNIYSAEYWEYDSRSLRRWNVDPVLKDWESPYMCFSGNPIWFSDPNGDKIVNAQEDNRQKKLDKLNKKQKKFNSFNGDTKAKGYNKAKRQLKRAERKFNKANDDYMEAQCAIEDLADHNNSLYNTLNTLKDPFGNTVDVYVDVQYNLNDNGEKVDGITETKPYGTPEDIITEDGERSTVRQVKSKYGVNTISVVIDKMVINKGKLFSHEGGHCSYIAKHIYEYSKWSKDNPGKSKNGHGGGNPSGEEAEMQEELYH